jgi:signal transduction histidine kinase
MNFSKVKVCSKEQPITVAITSSKKPIISDTTVKKWQDTIDLLSTTISVPSALIMILEEKNIRVFLRSNTEGNPYERGEKAALLSGLYCETVIGNNDCLLIPNALKDPLWNENPDIHLNMISYLGLPIQWPDKEVFGTLCVLDNKENHYTDHYIKLMALFKNSIENDLQLILEKESLKNELENRTKLEQTIIENKILICEKVEYERVRNDFFANISHELRTPINVILSALQLIEHKQSAMNVSNTFSDKYHGIMKQNCFRLLRLVNNIIEITKIDTDYFDIHPQNMDIVEFCKDIVYSVTEYISNRGINLFFHTEIEKCIIALDPDKMEAVFLNLLSNAIKFSKAGDDITVSITTTNKFIVISVKDTGEGIPKEMLDVIFERFRQVNKSLTRAHEGSGIGLSLVKALVEKHGGNISVQSQIGKGSQFNIALPIGSVTKDAHKTQEIACSLYNDRIEKINIEFSDIYNL